MSYQSKKRKKSKLNKLKFFIGLVLIKFFNKIKKIVRRERTMRVQGTRRVMEFLRARNKIIRGNNLGISEWVDEYLDRCFINGEPVNILTQWCLSKDLEERLKKQGGQFMPTKKERKLFEAEFQGIISVLSENGFRLNWWITFNRSYLDSGRIDRELEKQYKIMIADLSQKYSLTSNVVFLDWEEDVLGRRPAPNRRLSENFRQYIRQGAFEIEFQRHSNWARKEAGLRQTDEELNDDVKFQIACEVEEGELLIGKDSPLGSPDFILICLEAPERYDFFTIFAEDFKKRIVSILPYYPWRV